MIRQQLMRLQLPKLNYRRAHQLTASSTAHPNAYGTVASAKFAKSKVGDFIQEQPRHENAFLSDQFLVRSLKRIMPGEVFKSIEPDLVRFGKRASSEIWRLGQECAVNEPYLRKTSAWGERMDEIVTCYAWKRQKEISAEEGLIAIPYERNFAEFSRLYQVAKLYMYSPSSGLYSCPLAMTDGAAKTIEANNLKDSQHMPFDHLTSREPNYFWTSGQWMTEKRGGSDVAQGTETIAIPCKDNEDMYRLHGYKWFSSATDSDMTLTLARVAGQDGMVIPGTKGISMFMLKTRDDAGVLNGIEVVKLKNKLGTRQLPTGELLIDGALAEMISAPGRGIACISNMLTVTRMHNIISSASGPRKLLSLARDYATRREAFGKKINQHTLHLQALTRMETETRGCTALMLDLAHKMGHDDCKTISDQDAMLLRLMTPVGKMYTAKRAVELTSEGLECFGGQGYIEDTGLPAFLRDAQVLPIWEGTSSVMSLDVLRAIHKTNGEVLNAFKNRVLETTRKGSSHSELKDCCSQLESSLGLVLDFIGNQQHKMETAARDLTVSLGQIYIAALLIEHASDKSDPKLDIFTAKHWMQRDLAPVVTQNEFGAYDTNSAVHEDYVYDGYDTDELIQPTFLK